MGPGATVHGDTRVGARVGAAWTDLRRASHHTALRDYLVGSDADTLEIGQLDMLDLLATRRDWRMGDLAEALRVDPSTATRAVRRLVTAGLAERGSHGIDGRVVTVRLTTAGCSRQAVIERRRVAMMRHLLDAFETAQRPVLAEMLERFVEAVDGFVDALADV
jgi:DNA-binding MarR family transcriptional regulator